MVVFFVIFLFAWFTFLYFAEKAVRSLPVLVAQAAGVEVPLSLVIAVKDDAKPLRATLTRLTEIQYPSLQIIVVDDRSSDGTRAVIESFPKVQGLHLSGLPRGWLGKVHALHRGVQLATGKYVLFMDADVAISEEMLRRSVALCETKKLDHLAVLPRVRCSSFFLELLVVTSEVLFTLSARPWLSLEARPLKCVKGIGPYNFVRKAYFDTTEGFEWLKMDVADDVALAQLIAKDGGRSLFMKVSEKDPVATWSWYDTAKAMFKGLEKNTAGGFTNYRLSLMLAMPAVSLGCFFIPLAGLCFPFSSPVFWIAVTACFATLVFAARCRPTLERPVAVLAMLPLGIALMGVILLRSSYLCLKNGGISWAGTFYPLKDLKAGTRVKLGL